MSFLDSLRQSRLLAILRGVESAELAMVAEASKRAGLRFMEITLNTHDAYAKIRSLARLSEDQFHVGAGTVLNATQARDAVAAGAMFLVAPILDPEVARAARELGVPYVPGALTPKEVYEAYRAGAAIVKVFPIRCYGPSYIRELRGPFGDIPLLGCGGIRQENLRQYLDAGIDAVALGESTFRREWLSAGNLMALVESLTEVIRIVESFERDASPSPAELTHLRGNPA